MPSTLYRPQRHQQVAEVVDLAAARARLRGTDLSGRTLLVRCSVALGDEEVLRHIGVCGDTTLEDFRGVIEKAFSLPQVDSPERFTHGYDDDGRLDPHDPLGRYLAHPGDELFFHWGLWTFQITALEDYLRDSATPTALCVAGAGSFPDSSFDIAAVNAQLLGPTAIQAVLGQTRPEVKDVVDRAPSLDFPALLKAMDLERPESMERRKRETLRSLPREKSPKARDAFWATVLAHSCMTDASTTDAVIEATMDALGYTEAHGNKVTAAGAKRLCSGSLVRLAGIGAYGPGSASAVDRLDVYRALLRRQGPAE
ncbi:hypothetical protein [Corynebacterium aquatimens]|uniref:Uncharacterized protein n=1 Tax=Corynebacterium aquatimens TaxID=1190508 RepID=A0A931GXV9_9CORY|nr:hypothetical protein [Corynebacterium aquatimens]MBG6122594.1 hypothetical protein [Corynebacterium aquatimens]WJY64866.1 hypothetical protein CAQUA_00590 [Corynebacterium aquatimens]